MTKIILTFDYELFFNKTYASFQDVLIDPTSSIFGVLSDNGVLATFFIDICMIRALKRQLDNGDLNAYEREVIESQLKSIKDQICWMYRNKMEVGLHMHMIWETAQYKDGEWTFDSSHYMPCSFSNEAIHDCISFGVSFLNELAVNSNAENIISFRAGGFAFEPSEYLFKLLHEEGIKIDSSVCKYAFCHAQNHHYDYQSIPTKNYWIMKSGKICCESELMDESMLEIPITATKDIPFKWTINHMYPRVESKKKGKSSEVVYPNPLLSYLDKMMRKLNGGVFLNCDFTNYVGSIKMIEHELKKNNSDDEIFVMIGHPKLQSEVSIRNLELFIRAAKERLGCEFITMREAYMQLIIQTERV